MILLVQLSEYYNNYNLQEKKNKKKQQKTRYIIFPSKLELLEIWSIEFLHIA